MTDSALRQAREALAKIADLNGCYGPFPEANSELWGPMAIVTAREALAAIDAALTAQAPAEPQASIRWSGRVVEVSYETHRAVVRYEGQHPRIGVSVNLSGDEGTLSDEDLADCGLLSELFPDGPPTTEEFSAVAQAAPSAGMWTPDEAGIVARKSGFSGTSWAMGPEELAHLLNMLRQPAPAAPAEPQPNAQGASGANWIPVSERLPEPDSGEVLVWLSGGRCAFDEWHMHREDPTGMSTTYTMETGLMWRDYEFEDITHWMPLPSAPPTPGA